MILVLHPPPNMRTRRPCLSLTGNRLFLNALFDRPRGLTGGLHSRLFLLRLPLPSRPRPLGLAVVHAVPLLRTTLATTHSSFTAAGVLLVLQLRLLHGLGSHVDSRPLRYVTTSDLRPSLPPSLPLALSLPSLAFLPLLRAFALPCFFSFLAIGCPRFGQPWPSILEVPCCPSAFF